LLVSLTYLNISPKKSSTRCSESFVRKVQTYFLLKRLTVS